MEIWNQFGIDTGYVLLGLSALTLILLIIVIVLAAKQRSLIKKYKVFMGRESGGSLERRMLDRFAKMTELEGEVNGFQDELKTIEKRLRGSYQKCAVVRYDAFNEAKGNISFALCLLDHNNSGIILNSMYANEGCYTYIRELKFGNSDFPLTEEEDLALQKAMSQKPSKDPAPEDASKEDPVK